MKMKYVSNIGKKWKVQFKLNGEQIYYFFDTEEEANALSLKLQKEYPNRKPGRPKGSFNKHRLDDIEGRLAVLERILSVDDKAKKSLDTISEVLKKAIKVIDDVNM